MKDLLMIGVILFAWIALNRWVLPAFGIQTCMSGACCGNTCRPAAERTVVPAEPQTNLPETDSRGGPSDQL
jgi:hypothetical protein